MFRIAFTTVAALALAYAAWADAAAALYGKFSPARGLSLSPHSAQALTRMTELSLSRKDNNRLFLRIARPNAERALASEPLSPRALRQLGTYWALKGDQAKARKLIGLSAKLSRRDSIGQLWLALDALKFRRSGGAMQALDVVLRTEPEAQELVFSVLGNSLGDPEFRDVFVRYAASRPPWLRSFVDFNIGTLKQPDLLSNALVRMKPLPRDILDDQAAGRLLTYLVDRAPIKSARDLYLHLPGSDRRTLTSLAFPRRADAFRFPPFGWELLSGNDVQGFGDVGEDGITIEALVQPGRRGTAARKLLFLPSGSYRWTGNANLEGMRRGASADIAVLCHNASGKWDKVSGRDLTAGANGLPFEIGAQCDAQMLTLNVLGSEGQTDSSMALSNMKLVPVARRDKEIDTAAKPEPVPAN